MINNNHTLKKASNKGFSLVELIVVIAIMAVLVGVIAPQFLGYIDKAKESRLKYNTQGYYDYVTAKSVDFSKDEWWGKHVFDFEKDTKIETLNNLIEKELLDNENDLVNNVSLINPYNDSTVIVNYYKSLPGDVEDGCCPAVFMTRGSQYAYESTGNTGNLKGTIVVYFETNNTDNGPTEYMQFYYVNEDGSKSDLLLTW